MSYYPCNYKMKRIIRITIVTFYDFFKHETDSLWKIFLCIYLLVNIVKLTTERSIEYYRYFWKIDINNILSSKEFEHNSYVIKTWRDVSCNILTNVLQWQNLNPKNHVRSLSNLCIQKIRVIESIMIPFSRVNDMLLAHYYFTRSCI